MEISSLIYLVSGLISIVGVYIAFSSKGLGSIHEYISIKTFIKQFMLPIAVAILGSILMLFSLRLDKVEDITVSNQISEIENIENSLKNLSVFLEHQKKEIYHTNEVIEKLKKDRAIFDSISHVDEQTIENIMAIQQRVSHRNIWKELGIAFVMGIITSIIAGRILSFIKKRN